MLLPLVAALILEELGHEQARCRPVSLNYSRATSL